MRPPGDQLHALGMTSPPVSFIKMTWFDDIQRRAALTFVP